MLIRIPKGWEMPEREATPEGVYLNRRQWLSGAGLLAAGRMPAQSAGQGSFPARRNPEFTLDRPVTEESAATGYNNFYEFHTDKEMVRKVVQKFVTKPWRIEVGGLVAKPQTFDLDDLQKRMNLEERLYRFRCVEAWAMAVPWTGFPFSELAKVVQPKPEARHVRFWTVNRPAQMPGITAYNWYPFPYYEGLRIDEAMNPLAMIVTGLYGKPLPKQNGAPVRMIVPWKYGYKSIKSVVKIEFAGRQPRTFWNELQPAEYGFFANVNPKRPHPRWSQETERLIAGGERRATMAYNGYEKWVAALYTGREF